MTKKTRSSLEVTSLMNPYREFRASQNSFQTDVACYTPIEKMIHSVFQKYANSNLERLLKVSGKPVELDNAIITITVNPRLVQ